MSLIRDAAFPDARITGRELPPGVDELVAVTAEGPLVIYARGLSTAGQRFAIAHALAHLLFDVGVDVHGVQPDEPYDAERETRADAFAFELLCPRCQLLQHIVLWPDSDDDAEGYRDQVDQIAAEYHLPPAAIDQQIRELARTKQ